MSLVVFDGSEMIRYNSSTASIEASNSRGVPWSMRYRCSGMGNIRALTLHKGEIILCSDQGFYVSKNSGKAWSKRNSSDRNFVDTAFMPTADAKLLCDKGFTERVLFGTDAPINLLFYKDMTTADYIRWCISNLKDSLTPEQFETVMNNKFTNQ